MLLLPVCDQDVIELRWEEKSGRRGWRQLTSAILLEKTKQTKTMLVKAAVRRIGELRWIWYPPSASSRCIPRG